MVGRSYLLERPAAPSAAKRWVDQQLFPVAIDAAGAVERVLEEVAQATRRQPAAVLGIAGGVGFLLAVVRWRVCEDPDQRSVT